jgi:hypothetical protein
MAPRDRLLAEAARFLATLLGTCPGEVEVTVRSADLKDGYTLRGPPPANAAEAPPAPATLPAGASWLSPLEEEILKRLPADGWLSVDGLAREIDPQATEAPRELRAVVTNLGDRGVIEYQKGRGCRRKAGG